MCSLGCAQPWSRGIGVWAGALAVPLEQAGVAGGFVLQRTGSESLFSMCLLEAHHGFQIIVLDTEKGRKQKLIRTCGPNKDSEATPLYIHPIILPANITV